MRRLLIIILLSAVPGFEPGHASAQSNTPPSTGITVTNRPAPPRLKVRDGFRMELVADGSLVESPTGMAFDERGRLYVAELRDDPTSGENEPLTGRVRLLEDNDGDGVFDTSVVFADKLERPSAVACSRGGVFVAGQSDLRFLLDQDGDEIADLERTLLRFNGSASPDHPFDHLCELAWGPDRRLYLTLPWSGASVLNVNTPSQLPLELDGGGLSFDPLTLHLRAESGSDVTGQTFDDAGHRYICSSTAALAVTILGPSEARRNPYAAVVPAAATLVPSGRGSGPSGCLIYRGRQYPTNLHGQAFLVDPSSSAIYLVKLGPGKTHPTAVSTDGTVLHPVVTSHDETFRPMQLAVGPDDLLYVADLGRRIGAGDANPSNSDAGTNPLVRQGRIWRLVPKTPSPHPASPPEFSDELTLMSALTSSNAWVRSTAARLFAEQGATDLTSDLRRVLDFSKSSTARLEALRSLNAAGAATGRDLSKALGDRDVSIRSTAAAIASERVTNGRLSNNLWASLRSRFTDPSPEVRLRTALTLGSVRVPSPAPLLADFYTRDSGDIWMRRAMLTAEPDTLPALFLELVREPVVLQSPTGLDLLLDLARSIGLGGRLDDVSDCLGTLGDLNASAGLTFVIISALAEGLDGRGLRLSDADQADHWVAIASTAQAVAVGGGDEQIRVEAIRVLGACVGPECVADEFLLLMFTPGLPVALQTPVIQALARQGLDRDFDALTQRWHLWEAPEQLATLDVLMQSDRGAEALLAALANGTIPVDGLTSVHINLLREHPDADTSGRAKRRLGSSQPNRDELVAGFVGALDLHGSIAKGRELFNTRCSYCHGPGRSRLGPPLREMRSLSPLQLVAGVVDPSRGIAADRRTVVLRLTGGRMAWGADRGGNNRVIQLATPEGTRRYLRQDVRSTDWSLMPDNSAAGLTRQDVADLVAFIQNSAVVQ